MKHLTQEYTRAGRTYGPGPIDPTTDPHAQQVARVAARNGHLVEGPDPDETKRTKKRPPKEESHPDTEESAEPTAVD